MDDEDDGGAWAHQQELDNRRRDEDEALARHRVLLNASRADLENFIRDSKAFKQRILQEMNRAQSQ